MGSRIVEQVGQGKRGRAWGRPKRRQPVPDSPGGGRAPRRRTYFQAQLRLHFSRKTRAQNERLLRQEAAERIAQPRGGRSGNPSPPSLASPTRGRGDSPSPPPPGTARPRSPGSCRCRRTSHRLRGDTDPPVTVRPGPRADAISRAGRPHAAPAPPRGAALETPARAPGTDPFSLPERPLASPGPATATATAPVPRPHPVPARGGGVQQSPLTADEVPVDDHDGGGKAAAAALAEQEPGARSERGAAGAALGGRGERAEKADSAAPQPHIEGKSPYVIARCAAGSAGSGDVARKAARGRSRAGGGATQGAGPRRASGDSAGTQCRASRVLQRRAWPGRGRGVAWARGGSCPDAGEAGPRGWGPQRPRPWVGPERELSRFRPALGARSLAPRLPACKALS